MSALFLGLAAVCALADWLAVHRGWQLVEFIAKPATILALIGFVFATVGIQPDLLWLVAGLLFSLVGDVFLMLRRGLFLLGLAAFLLTHISYTIGFNPVPPMRVQHLVAALLISLLVALPAREVYRRVAAALQASGKARLKLPTLVYALALCIMLISALFTLLRGDWVPIYSLAVSAGAILFILSDTLLVWNRFVLPLPSSRVWVHITYHIGQALIVIGATFQFLIAHLS
jgi:uncharacterized membrane protein YhhN